MFDSGVVVFSKSICPNCVTLKNQLNAKGISFTEIKVDEDMEALAYLKQQGFRAVPVLMKDGVVVKVEEL